MLNCFDGLQLTKTILFFLSFLTFYSEFRKRKAAPVVSDGSNKKLHMPLVQQATRSSKELGDIFDKVSSSELDVFSEVMGDILDDFEHEVSPDDWAMLFDL